LVPERQHALKRAGDFLHHYRITTALNSSAGAAAEATARIIGKCGYNFLGKPARTREMGAPL
jgi:hypothetical protein